MKKLLSVTGLLMWSMTSFASPITVHNTGVDGTDALVSAGVWGEIGSGIPGGTTSFWSLTDQPVGAGYALGSAPFRLHHPSYAADLSNAAWVSPGGNGSGTAGLAGGYTYTQIIDLAGLDPTSAVITGQFSSDNDSVIGVNGVTAASSGGFDEFKLFSISSGFHSGLNSIYIRVHNAGDPTAFIVVFDSATANSVASSVPDSGGISLVLLGLAPLLLARRMRILSSVV